jgi:hypothetical protein
LSVFRRIKDRVLPIICSREFSRGFAFSAVLLLLPATCCYEETSLVNKPLNYSDLIYLVLFV